MNESEIPIANTELTNSTKQLMVQLKHFIIHVIGYFLTNIILSLITLYNFTQFYWLLYLMVIWAIALVIHGIHIYRSEPSLKQKLKLLFSA